MKQYHDLLERIIDTGINKSDRTGTGTRSVFGHQMRFDLTKGFPLVTTKRVFWKGVVAELLWMLSGSTSVRPLQEQGVTIWDEWADANGELGPVYGRQWRSWQGYKPASFNPDAPGLIGNLDNLGTPVCSRQPIDQIQEAIDLLLDAPDSRRIIVSAWNPAEIDEMRLPPCHMMFQFYTRPMTLRQRLDLLDSKYEHWELDGLVPGLESMEPQEGEKAICAALDADGIPSRFLDLQLYQRSADVFLGVPFNIASYALLLTMIAREVGMVSGEFVWTGGDTHLYANHLEAAHLQLTRDPKPLPSISFTPDAPFRIFDIRREHIVLDGYDPHPPIHAEVSV